jgi:hypothetical protein
MQAATRTCGHSVVAAGHLDDRTIEESNLKV